MIIRLRLFGQLLTGALAGYAFSMLEFKGKQVLFFIMLSTMMIPGQAIIIANYLTVSRMGLINTYGALILPYLTSAFCVFNMRQAFLQLPVESVPVAPSCHRFQEYADRSDRTWHAAERGQQCSRAHYGRGGYDIAAVHRRLCLRAEAAD